MKLSDPQKKVIRMARAGWDLGAQGLSNETSFKRVPSHTMESLKKLKLIENLVGEGFIFNYRLTELGKTIQL